MNLKLPSWFRQEIPDTITLQRAQKLSVTGVHTVCQEARCPNLSFCFQQLKFTFMILGDTCTRNCQFCGVRKTDNKSLDLDLNEPYRLAEKVKELKLNYVVITAVTRDDLADGGAKIFDKTIELIHHINQDINPVRNTVSTEKYNKISNGVKVEVLIPDFKGSISSLRCLVDAHPDLVAHNIETVERLYKDLRPEANYQLSLQVLRKIKEIQPMLTTKSSIMLGLGETEGEVIKTMEDLLNSGCDILTLGQYLAPSENHYPVKEFISIAQFQRYRDIGLALGFKAVLSGPLVRSSYRAEEVYEEVNILARKLLSS